jgi:hypothetical protein
MLYAKQLWSVIENLGLAAELPGAIPDNLAVLRALQAFRSDPSVEIGTAFEDGSGHLLGAGR